jgi:hypothetical protein
MPAILSLSAEVNQYYNNVTVPLQTPGVMLPSLIRMFLHLLISDSSPSDEHRSVNVWVTGGIGDDVARVFRVCVLRQGCYLRAFLSFIYNAERVVGLTYRNSI